MFKTGVGRDILIRWNSTFIMVERAIILKDAYQSMCQNEPSLGAYSLEEEEWIYLDRLCELLREFNAMTKAVSASVRFPTINRAMSVYNALIDTLEGFIEKDDDPVLTQAAEQGKEKLLKYYSKTVPHQSVYAVATAIPG